jgi:CHAT domain-containing protein
MFCLSSTLRRLPLHTLNICNSIVHTDEGNSQPLLHRILLSRFVVFLCFVLHSRLRSMLSIYIRRSVLIFYLAFQKQMRQLRLIDAKRTTQLRERESIVELAQACDTSPMIEDSASKAMFLRALERSRLLHLHMHCDWQFSDPPDHHVKFPNLLGSNHLIKNEYLKLTAKEIFATRLVPGTHINLISCQRGLLQVIMGDEVMGFVPALLYSRATSIASTLWSITDSNGARFSKHIFDLFPTSVRNRLSFVHFLPTMHRLCCYMLPTRKIYASSTWLQRCKKR